MFSDASYAPMRTLGRKSITGGVIILQGVSHQGACKTASLSDVEFLRSRIACYPDDDSRISGDLACCT